MIFGKLETYGGSMKKYLFIVLVPLLFNSCDTINNKEELKTLAEKYFEGIYGCDTSVVDELAAPNIEVTYPVFEKIFGHPVIRGRDSLKSFVKHFCTIWKAIQFNVDETIAEGNRVVIAWRFKARNIGSIQGRPPTNQVNSWGGITFFRFNKQNQITQEIGEESTPGPFARLTSQKN